MGIFSFPFCDWCPLWVRTFASRGVGGQCWPSALSGGRGLAAAAMAVAGHGGGSANQPRGKSIYLERGDKSTERKECVPIN
eukprot:7711241-Pyramimonas_sp.AAC.1